jgi:hypothetical protein
MYYDDEDRSIQRLMSHLRMRKQSLLTVDQWLISH